MLVLAATLGVLLGAPAAALEAEPGRSASIDHAEAQLARLATVLG
jgi:hypothetical protein